VEGGLFEGFGFFVSWKGSEVGGLNSPLLRLCSEGEDCDSSC